MEPDASDAPEQAASLKPGPQGARPEPAPIQESATSEAYRLRLAEVAGAFAEHYLRTFWWFALAIPLGGVLCLALIHAPIGELLGVMMLLWPLTIPARAVLVAATTWRQLGKETRLTVTNEAVYLKTDAATPLRVGFDWLRRVRRRGDLFLLEGPRYTTLPIRASAFSPEGLAAAEAHFRAAGLLSP